MTLVIFWEKSVRRISVSISVVTLTLVILFRIFILGNVVITYCSFTSGEYYLITKDLL